MFRLLSRKPSINVSYTFQEILASTVDSLLRENQQHTGDGRIQIQPQIEEEKQKIKTIRQDTKSTLDLKLSQIQQILTKMVKDTYKNRRIRYVQSPNNSSPRPISDTDILELPPQNETKPLFHNAAVLVLTGLKSILSILQKKCSQHTTDLVRSDLSDQQKKRICTGVSLAYRSVPINDYLKDSSFIEKCYEELQLIYTPNIRYISPTVPPTPYVPDEPQFESGILFLITLIVLL